MNVAQIFKDKFWFLGDWYKILIYYQLKMYFIGNILLRVVELMEIMLLEHKTIVATFAPECCFWLVKTVVKLIYSLKI